MEIRYARELGIDAGLLRAAGDRIRAALDAAGDRVPLHETMLVVVGRGASDPDANGNVAKVMRMLWEGFGFGWGESAYSGVTFPLVEPALSHAAKLGYRRIVVFPWFLFTRGARQAYLRAHRPGRGPAPRDRVRQGVLLERPSRGARHLRGSGSRRPCTART